MVIDSIVPLLRAKAVRLVLTIVLLWPVVFFLLTKFEHSIGLLWLFAFQIYYVPYGTWMPQPFFEPDPELSFRVLLPGAFVGAVANAGLVLVGAALLNALRKKQSSS